MVLILAILTLSGFNFAFWMIVGFLRFVLEEILGIKQESTLDNSMQIDSFSSSNQSSIRNRGRITVHETAAIIAAHNEELSIENTIRSLQKMLPSENIYVGSDGSTDRTVEISRSLGVNVADIQPNRGKAKVLRYLLRRFNLYYRYKAVTIVDADIEFNDKYYHHILPLFNDPTVAAAIGRSIPPWKTSRKLEWAMLFTAFRTRLYKVLQFGLRYGQTWRYLCATAIIPGAYGTYRTSVLKEIDIYAPDLIIEDFNMTFAVHHQRLGRIAFNLRAHIYGQQPYTMRDYIKQVKRWYIGFWQTVFRHGFWPSFFWFTMFLYTLEMIFYSFFMISVPVLFVAFLLNSFEPITTINLFPFSRITITFQDLVATLLLVDALITLVIAILIKRPQMLIYWPGFIVIRWVDSLVWLLSIPVAFFKKSTGQWVSPQRRAI